MVSYHPVFRLQMKEENVPAAAATAGTKHLGLHTILFH